jgi:hypothetical protein
MSEIEDLTLRNRNTQFLPTIIMAATWCVTTFDLLNDPAKVAAAAAAFQNHREIHDFQAFNRGLRNNEKLSQAEKEKLIEKYKAE